MQIFRRGRYLTICTRLLAAAVVLRAFIAPGFMLSVSADDSLGIVFCNGPAGIHAPVNGHSAHQHHGDNGKTGQQAHVTSMCSHWSSSSHFVAVAFFVPSLDTPLPVKSYAVYQPDPQQKFPGSPRVTRGPPSPV